MYGEVCSVMYGEVSNVMYGEIYIYIYICVCVCVCVYINSGNSQKHVLYIILNSNSFVSVAIENFYGHVAHEIVKLGKMCMHISKCLTIVRRAAAHENIGTFNFHTLV